MAMPALSAARDHLVVAHRAAGLDDRRGAGDSAASQPVGEGEEGVRRDAPSRWPATAAGRPCAAASAFQAAMRE
jgi:hypothetical protein